MSQWPIASVTSVANAACEVVPLRIKRGDTLALLGRFGGPSGQDMTGWVPTASLWPAGGSPGSEITVTAVWVAVATGDLRLSLTALQTLALALGLYALQVRIADSGGQVYTLDPGVVEVVAVGPASV